MIREKLERLDCKIGGKAMINLKSINWFFPCWLVIGAILCVTGKVSWWVLLLIILNDVKVEIKK